MGGSFSFGLAGALGATHIYIYFDYVRFLGSAFLGSSESAGVSFGNPNESSTRLNSFGLARVVLWGSQSHLFFCLACALWLWGHPSGDLQSILGNLRQGLKSFSGIFFAHARHSHIISQHKPWKNTFIQGLGVRRSEAFDGTFESVLSSQRRSRGVREACARRSRGVREASRGVRERIANSVRRRSEAFGGVRRRSDNLPHKPTSFGFFQWFQ